jgi:Cellulase (glycosyl hydrolase family 5)
LPLRHFKSAWFVPAAFLATVCCGLAASPAGAHTVAKGIMDLRLERGTHKRFERALREDTRGLHAQFTRILVDWAQAQPTGASHYNTAYLDHIKRIVQACKQHGLKVIVTLGYTPRWASDRTFWSHPPPTYSKGVYRDFYPIAPAHLPDFGRFTLKLAQLLQGDVFGYECWNEPNLWPWIYPQRTAGDPHFAVTRYVAMLRQFSPAIRRGDPQALVIAGATAPMGDDDRLRTSPLSFAQTLKADGAAKLFDAYSHHPYTIGGMRDPAPGAMPPWPNAMVTLANLKMLLHIFPGKPFYLTEYGYNTRPCMAFGYFFVSDRTQARYLRSAYAMADRYQQVKLLMWFQAKDWRPPGRPAYAGLYMGLRRLNGTKKPSWWAFARLP